MFVFYAHFSFCCPMLAQSGTFHGKSFQKHLRPLKLCGIVKLTMLTPNILSHFGYVASFSRYLLFCIFHTMRACSFTLHCTRLYTNVREFLQCHQRCPVIFSFCPATVTVYGPLCPFLHVVCGLSSRVLIHYENGPKVAYQQGSLT